MYYLQHYWNLYCFSQQGWDAWWEWGKKDERNSKSKLIGCWLQQRMMFLSGQYKKYFGEDGKAQN
jgi:hypothetical protein